MSRSSLRVIAGLTAIGLLAAACGSSSSTSSTSTTVKATGSPIVVGQINPMTGANLALPEVGSSLLASVNALNNAGGINGHPLKLIQCDTKGDAATEVQCAQNMVNDHVVATLSDNTFSASAQVNQILAGIPRIGVTMFDVSDYSNTTNFDLTGGGVFSLVGMMDGLINKGYKKLTVVVPDTPTSSQTHLLLDPVAKAQGVEVVNYVMVSSASGDYSQYVAQAQQNGSQAVAIALGNAQLVQFAQAINQLNPNIAYATGIAGFSLNQLKQLGQFSKKCLFTWWTPGIDDVKNFPGMAQPLSVLTHGVKGATVNNLTALSLSGWLSVHALSEVLKSETGTPTAASLLAALKAAKNIPMNGILKPWTPTNYASAGPLSSVFKNVSNPYQYLITYNGTNTSTNNSSAMFNVTQGLNPTTTTTTSK